MNGPLTHPGRFAAWVLVRLRGLPTDGHAGSFSAAWRLAAHIYRDRAINTMQGLRMAQQDIRTLQQALDKADDARPLSGGELDAYVVGLRERNESLWMHCVDLRREREQAEASAAAQRATLQRIAEVETIVDLDGQDAEQLRTHLISGRVGFVCEGCDEARRLANATLRDDAGRTLLAELAAARAMAAEANRRRGQTGNCSFCGFGEKLGGEEFHGSGCVLAAYNEAVKGGTGDAS